jgi:hypothetical protein
VIPDSYQRVTHASTEYVSPECDYYDCDVDGYCCDQIDLPPYKDYASLEQKLTLAVEETVGFGCVHSHGFSSSYPVELTVLIIAYSQE